MKLKLLAAALFLCLSTPAMTPSAQAVSIRNTDKEAHFFTLEDCGTLRKVTLLPEQRIRQTSACVRILQENGQRIRTRTQDEYIIKNGEFLLQSRRQRRGN